MTAEVFGKRIDALFGVVGPSDRWRGPGQLAAHLFGMHDTNVSRWRNGHRAIPYWVWRTLNALSACAELGGRDAILYAIMDEAAPEKMELPDLGLRT